MRSPLLADLAATDCRLWSAKDCSRPSASSPRRSRRTSSWPTASSVLNLCANNYLGLADQPRHRRRRPRTHSTEYGYGMASVRFICGTQTVHKELEARLSAFLGTDDTILYSSCFDANGGLFETILDEQDAVISDALNHASIIDGIRLCRAQRLRYDNNDMDQLEQRLQESSRCPLPADRDRRRVLDGRCARQPAGDLRPRRAVRRNGDGRRLARGRVRRRPRPRHARVRRRDGARRHHHRHARQGPGRSVRWLHGGPPRGHRLVASAVAAVPVLQQPGPGHRVGDHPRARPAGGRRRAATVGSSATPSASAPASNRQASRWPVPGIPSSR